jgi:single stranded DNA-binding protein
MAIRHENKVELVGKVIADPEIKSTQNGKRFASFKLVTEENRKNKDTGEWERESEFHNVTVWNSEAVGEIEDTVHKFCIVRLKGKIKTRKWQGQDGADRYTTGIVVDNFGEFEYLEAAREQSEERKPAAKSTAARKPVYTNNRPQDEDTDEIPF